MTSCGMLRPKWPQQNRCYKQLSGAVWRATGAGHVGASGEGTMTHRITEGKPLRFTAAGLRFWEQPWTCSCGASGVSRGASREAVHEASTAPHTTPSLALILGNLWGMSPTAWINSGYPTSHDVHNL